ncbi:MAG TPA: GNAT family N-acetyltransferase [Phycisphaerae bacterium]|nr:GNAT family N-acetyltransferase [Phycisphaerae bacterium]
MLSYKTGENSAQNAPQDPFHVRTFQASDGDAVTRLYNDGVLHGGDVECVDCGAFSRISETYLSRPQDHFWVAEADGKVIGTVAICEDEPSVAHLHWLRVDQQWQFDNRVALRLVETAAKHARQYGYLKLIVHTRVDAAKAIEFFEHRGFEFNRARNVEGTPRLEFYLHLYELEPQVK